MMMMIARQAARDVVNRTSGTTSLPLWLSASALKLNDGSRSTGRRPNIPETAEGFSTTCSNFWGETRGSSTSSPARTQLPRHKGALVGNWLQLAKALLLAGPNLQGEVASPVF
jgi:hypothetical protein